MLIVTTFLKLFGVLTAVALLVAIASGYLVGHAIETVTHVIVGLTAVFTGMLLLSILMFYLIGTGSAIKEAANRKAVPEEDYLETRKFKVWLFPPIILALVILIATPILGAAYDTGRIELYLHSFGAWFCFIFYTFVHLKSRTVLTANRAIFENAVNAGKRE